MPRILIPCALLASLLIAVAPATAGFVIDQATTGDGDATDPHLASSPDGQTMVAYHLTNNVVLMSFVVAQAMPTDPDDNDPWAAPVTFNAGSHPRIAWSREGFISAFISGDAVLIYHSDLEGNWDLVDYELMFPGDAVVNIDLWASPWDGAGPYAYLVIETFLDPPFGDRRLQFCSLNAYGWSDLETLVHSSEYELMAKVTWIPGSAGPWPTVFYYDHSGFEPQLVHTTKDLVNGWTTPTSVPGPIMGPFEVVTYNGYDRSLLGAGAQPTCPCGTIHHVKYEAGTGWLDDENLTVHHANMDWPMSANIDIDPEGRLHAFWYQQGSGLYLDPVTRTLEYWVKEDGVWTEHGQFLDEQEGAGLEERVAMDVSEAGAPVLAWSRRDTLDGEPQPERVWVARPTSEVAVPDVPARELAVKAWPNPFNPFVQIEFTLPRSAVARATVHDLRGRLVATLHDGALNEGTHLFVWQGRDDGGREQPSGVYLVRLKSGDGVAHRKVVLER